MTAQSADEPHGAAFSHLRSSHSTYRLSQIEKIRAFGVGDLIALPQLVVCGDQSSGKSSVLEGITGIPFPRQDGLCTRFPTEIILRHTGDHNGEVTIVATIRPHASRPPNERESLKSFKKVISNMSELPVVIAEVSVLMKIRGYVDDPSSCCFASDALRIEISGDIGLHLSVVDLPGLISVASEDQTQEDVDAVRDMVGAYLENSRTIILAVLQAGSDMAIQPIIQMARDHDQHGQRTVGIITKPDLVNKGTEEKLVRVVRNEENIKLKLGFFLVKNPSPEDLKTEPTMHMRSVMEMRFFNDKIWAGIDQDRIGAKNLSSFLQRLLDTHIEREFPKVQQDMRKKLAEVESNLQSIGEARSTTNQMRHFLTELSMRFFQLSRAALEGNYNSLEPDFFKGQASRLRARIQESNTKFATKMRLQGETRRVGRKLKNTGFADGEGNQDLESTNETAQQIVSKDELLQWVKQTYLQTRGQELPGSNNPILLSELFREQSQSWASLAKDHIESILSLTVDWTTLAVRTLVREDHVRAEIEAILEEWLAGSKRCAIEELGKLLDDESNGPLTYNHYYTDNVQKGRLDAQKKAMEKAIAQAATDEYNNKLHISNNGADIERFVATLGTRIVVDMDEQACHEAVTQLDAYYKVALKTFVDNVARQVIERHIIVPLSKAFWPNTVSQFSEEALRRIASEPAKQTRRRNDLIIAAEGLKRSLQELRQPPPEN